MPKPNSTELASMKLELTADGQLSLSILQVDVKELAAILDANTDDPYQYTPNIVRAVNTFTQLYESVFETVVSEASAI
jgi:hypothetical protein